MHDSFVGKKYWWELAKKWRDIRHPVRPSKGDLKIYEGFLNKEKRRRKNLKILVLGATPEMRDLAAKYGSEVVVCDLSINMIIAMTELMRKENKNEIWIKASWITVPLKHNYFDVILSILCSISLIPSSKETFFFGRLTLTR